MVIKNDLTTVEKVRREGGREGEKKMNLIKHGHHGPSLANLYKTTPRINNSLYYYRVKVLPIIII